MTDKREKAAAAESAKGLRRDRFEERSRSSDGKSAEDKQDL